jgi:alkylation response protein AidB-like acyl-CoA dehydrogenase
MNFDFEQEQYAFRDSFARYLAQAFPRGNDGRLDRSDVNFDEEWNALAELGLFALLIPENYGGIGLSFVDLSLIVEELGKVLAPLAITDTLVATDLILRFANEELKQSLFPRIAAGECRIAIAILEAEAGYDPAACRTVLESEGNRLCLSGRKILVPHAARADYWLVVARKADTDEPTVLLIPHNAPAPDLRSHESIDPSCAHGELIFDRLPVDPGTVLDGHEAAVRLFDVSATVASGLLLGLADTSLNLAVDYARQRVQFGQPIGAFQAIKHRCADMAVAAESSRSATYYAFWAIANDPPDRSRTVSIAKSFTGETAGSICNESIQIHGGMGFTWELGLHHYLRRCKVLEYSHGDAAFHRERLVTEAIAAIERQNDMA